MDNSHSKLTKLRFVMSPYERSNEGESLDKDFFKRLNRFEKYFKNNIENNKLFETNWQAMKKINLLIDENIVTSSSIEKAIDIYNTANSDEHYDGSGWFDLRLHLRHIAFVFGTEYSTDKDLNLVQKGA